MRAVTLDDIRRDPGNRPWLIALAFVLAGGLYLAVAGIDSSVTVDDGFYQQPVTSLRTEGEWSFDYVLAEVDDEGAAAQWSVGSWENGFFTNVRRPLWLLGLTGADLLGGIPAQRLLVLASGAAAVLAAAALARSLGSRRAAWIAAALTAMSPLAFNALQFWAHAPAAAAFTMVLWTGLRVMESEVRVPSWVVGAGLAGAAVTPAIRTDGGIYIVAVAAVTGLTGLVRRRWGIAAYGAVLGVVAIGSHVGSAYASAWITGGPTPDAGGPAARTLVTRGSTTVASRLEGSLETFVSGVYSNAATYGLLLAALLACAYAATLVRRGEHGPAAGVLGVAGVLWFVRAVVEPGDFATGLLGAWPVVVLVFAEPLRERSASEKRVAAILTLAFVGVAATQYDVGGGLNWGGRFVSAALPALAMLLAATLSRLRMQPRGALLLSAALGLAAVVTVASFAADWQLRTGHDQQLDALEAADVDLPVVTSSQALPNIAWRMYPDVRFVWVRDDVQAEVVVERLRDAGYDSVVGYWLSEDHADVLTGGRWDGGDLKEPVELTIDS